MARTLTCLYGKTIFEVLKNLLVFGRASPTDVKCPDGVSQHFIPPQWAQSVCSHGLIHWKWPEHWTACVVKRTFQVSRSLLVSG